MPLGIVLILALSPVAPAWSAAAGGIVLLTSPAAPVAGAPLRGIAVSERPRELSLAVIAPTGKTLAHSGERHGGPPYWWSVEATVGEPGVYRVCANDDVACEAVLVGDRPRPRRATNGRWPITREWNRATEDLYAAWVEHLFTDPLDADPSWHWLHEVTRQPERNFLYDHLGLGEDGEDGLRLEPDCSDLPYVLRAYFAWKLGLPFGYSECSRGADGDPPTCPRWHSALEPLGGGVDSLNGMQSFLQRLVDTVQSGAGRAPATDDRTDFYPTRLAADTLRPGTVYADPYGHMLLLVQRVPQTSTAAGMLLAVDAQPDGTVARKRYWRGNFLFALDPTLGSAGFKHFRPIVAEGGRLRPLDNAEIDASPYYGDYSLEQYDHGVEGFYDRVDVAISPRRLEPLARVSRYDRRPGRAGAGAAPLGRERRGLRGDASRHHRDAGGGRDLRDDRCMGGLRHAVARLAPVDRVRRGARVPGEGGGKPAALLPAAGTNPPPGQEAARRDAARRIDGAARRIYPQRRVELGRSRWPTCWRAPMRSRSATTPTTASRSAGAHRREARSSRPAGAARPS